MGVDYTNLSLGYPIFDVVSAIPRSSPTTDAAGEAAEKEVGFKPLPVNAFVVVGGGGSSRSGIKNSICILSLEENEQGLVQAKVLLNHFTGTSLLCFFLLSLV